MEKAGTFFISPNKSKKPACAPCLLQHTGGRGKERKEMRMKTQVKDLRSALELLRGVPGQLIETDVEVDPMAQLAGVYRHVGAGGTVMRPTKRALP